MLTHKEFKARELRRPEVRAEYDRIEDEFSILDEFLKMHAAASINQAEDAFRIAEKKHSARG